MFVLDSEDEALSYYIRQNLSDDNKDKSVEYETLAEAQLREESAQKFNDNCDDYDRLIEDGWPYPNP